MYLSERKTLRLFTLCALYVAQGIPWGFVTVTFAAWLAAPEHGISTDQLGKILAVASLPWSFKFVWGPLMDRFTIPSLGRRRPWIIFAQGMAILVLAGMIAIDDLPGMVWGDASQAGPLWIAIYELVPGPLAALILIANIFVSMQDVAVDALAVDLLEEKERGIANGLMYGSSYAGTAIGGAGLGFVVANYGIQAGLFGQAVLLFLIMLLPMCIRERRFPEVSEKSSSELSAERPDAQAIDFGESPYLPPRDQQVDTSATQLAANQDSADTTARGVGATSESVVRNLLTAFSLRSTLLGVLVALGVKIGIGVLTAVFVDYLMKEGGWTQQQYTTVTGGWALALGLTGSALGGFIADRLGPRPVIFSVSVLLGGLWVSFGLGPTLISSRSFVIALLLSQEFLLAVLSVSLFSLFMSISWPKVAATQFTAYMSLMNLSTTIGSYTAGRLSASLSIHQILIVAGLLQILMVIPVLFIDPRQTRRVLK